MAIVEHINPRILAWARETAGLTAEEAAGRLGLKDTARATAAAKLLQAEEGTRAVSRGLLQKAVAVYRRPLIAFYLPQPPARGERGEDFRTAPGAVSPRDNAMLDALIRDVRARQEMLRELLVDDEDTRPLAFVGSCTITQSAGRVAASVRQILGITVTDQRRAHDAAGLFAVLRTAAERAGVYVLLLGDLGTHHSDIGEEVFRGFALADDLAPFVVINDNDAAPARAFILLHELAHVWVGATGVSGPLRGAADNKVERFCNAVAGEFLLPPEAVADLRGAQGADVPRALALTDAVARAWNVSQGVVTYRFLMNGWISDEVAAALFKTFADRWRAERQRTRATKEPDDTGPSFYIVRRSRLGAALLDVVRRAVQGDVLTHTKAARILGVSPSNVDQLLHERPRAA